MGELADLVRRCLPSPEVDLARLVRDEQAFGAAVGTISHILDPELESAAVWLGAGRCYRGIEGFRHMWLDWLEPWATYHVQVEGVIEEDDRYVMQRMKG